MTLIKVSYCSGAVLEPYSKASCFTDFRPHYSAKHTEMGCVSARSPKTSKGILGPYHWISRLIKDGTKNFKVSPMSDLWISFEWLICLIDGMKKVLKSHVYPLGRGYCLRPPEASCLNNQNSFTYPGGCVRASGTNLLIELIWCWVSTWW